MVWLQSVLEDKEKALLRNLSGQDLGRLHIERISPSVLNPAQRITAHSLPVAGFQLLSHGLLLPGSRYLVLRQSPHFKME